MHFYVYARLVLASRRAHKCFPLPRFLRAHARGCACVQLAGPAACLGVQDSSSRAMVSQCAHLAGILTVLTMALVPNVLQHCGRTGLQHFAGLLFRCAGRDDLRPRLLRIHLPMAREEPARPLPGHSPPHASQPRTLSPRPAGASCSSFVKLIDPPPLPCAAPCARSTPSRSWTLVARSGSAQWHSRRTRCWWPSCCSRG